VGETGTVVVVPDVSVVVVVLAESLLEPQPAAKAARSTMASRERIGDQCGSGLDEAPIL